MRQDLRAFVRIDSRNRVIPGSLVLRKKEPNPFGHNGRWFEIQAYLCCAAPGTPGGPQLPITIALPTLDVGNPNYHINLTVVGVSTGDIDTGTTTPAALATYLTTNYSAAGTYVISGTNLIFTPTVAGSTLAITAGA